MNARPEKKGKRSQAPQKAVALRYDSKREGAPRVVARGRGDIAERILAAARENGVPVREDADLLELLAVCDLGAEIPEEIYAVVAELLTYLWRLNEDLRGAAETGTSHTNDEKV